MSEQLEIAPGTVLTVLSHDARELVLEARYDGGGNPPPSHLHPAQDEHFEILQGAMHATVGDWEIEVCAGDELEVPRGTVHKMWNGGDEVAVTRWVTTPAGRTLDWFREIAAALRGEPIGDPASLLERYEDVFRLADW